jgi:hypothetical protein
VRSAQQIICRKCNTMSTVEVVEKLPDGVHYVRCKQCAARNQIVQTGATPSQPGVLQVIQVLE